MKFHSLKWNLAQSGDGGDDDGYDDDDDGYDDGGDDDGYDDDDDGGDGDGDDDDDDVCSVCSGSCVLVRLKAAPQTAALPPALRPTRSV